MVEGSKSVQELLDAAFDVVLLAATSGFLEANAVRLRRCRGEIVEVTGRELESVGEYRTNSGALAVARMRDAGELMPGTQEYALALDNIQDPGNLGTIIRTADWYGISRIIASEDTADMYNGKVIQASMGSFTRVSVHYTDLPAFLSGYSGPVMGAFLDGADVHGMVFPPGGIVVIGNEGNGISPAVEKLITHRITIPRYGQAESLNAGMAAGIILDNIRRAGSPR